MKNDMNTLIHLPDLLFVQWYSDEFGINRGVYNTIDSWFYHKGIREITQRRKYILNFTLCLYQDFGRRQKIKFGHGGLVTNLNNYWEGFIERKLKQNAY